MKEVLLPETRHSRAVEEGPQMLVRPKTISPVGVSVNHVLTPRSTHHHLSACPLSPDKWVRRCAVWTHCNLLNRPLIRFAAGGVGQQRYEQANSSRCDQEDGQLLTA